MATVVDGISRTFSEFLLLPGLTPKDLTPDRVSLKTPLVRFEKGSEPALSLNTPVVSSIMQAVSHDGMAISLARAGGLSFLYGSQSIEAQSEMVSRVKNFKAGFVKSDSNMKESDGVADALALSKRTGHSSIAITADGSATGRFLGMVSAKEIGGLVAPTERLSSFMTKVSDLVTALDGITLKEANEIIWKKRVKYLPILSANGDLISLVFRRDFEEHKENPVELVDGSKRLCVGAGINSRDYKERVPALVNAGVDVVCVDSSDGFTEWQSETIQWVKKNYGDRVRIGGGNIVDGEGFRYLADAGADFVKVGVGGGSICITREQKGIGRGQASAIMDVVQARNVYYRETGIYVPICSDGGISQDYHIILALAMGADFVMMGRYFARFDESPAPKVKYNGNLVKEYWAEGSARARNWQRYDLGGAGQLSFEEGVDCYVPYAGKMKDTLDLTISKVKSTMVNCGASSLPEFADKAKLTIISSMSLREGGTHDIYLKDTDASWQSPAK